MSVVIVLATVASTTTDADAAAWLPPQQAPAASVDAGAPQIALGAGEALTVVWQDAGTNRIMAAGKAAGLALAALPVISGADLDARDPQVASSPAGWVVVVWRNRTGANAGVRVADRANGTFGAATTVPGSTATAQAPRVAVARDGTTAVAWSQVVSEGSGPDPEVTRAVMTSVRPPGGMFGAPAVLRTVVDDPIGPIDLAVGADGTFGASFANDGVRYSLRPPGGTFGPAVSVPDASPEAADPQIEPTGGPSGVLVWSSPGSGEGSVVVSAVVGPASGPPVIISATDAGADDIELAADDEGDVLAIWANSVGSASTIRSAMRPAGGTFASPESRSGPSGSDAMPTFARSGSAAIVYSETIAGVPVIRVTTQRPDGTFEDPVTISDAAESEVGAPVAGYAATGDGAAAWLSSAGNIRVAGFDGAPPALVSALIPGRLAIGEAGAFSADGIDFWTAVSSYSWDFGDTTAADGMRVSHAYAAGGSFDTGVTLADSAGNSRRYAAGAVVVESPGPPPPPAGPPPTATVSPPASDAVPPPVSDVVAPVITNLRLNRTLLRPTLVPSAPELRGQAAAVPLPRGTTAQFDLSEASRLKLSLFRMADVPRLRSRCLSRGAGPRPLTLGVRQPGRVLVRGLGVTQAGRKSFSFAGWLGARRLTRGRYEVMLVATDASGNSSSPARTRFTLC